MMKHIGNMDGGAVTMCCAGILIAPSIIPMSVATVNCLWFSNIYLISLLIIIKPSPAPIRNTIISMIEILCNAFIMYSYCPNNRSNDDPEIPGSSIAHIAMKPDMNSTGSECVACIGFNPTNIYVRIAKMMVVIIAFKLNASNCLYSTYIEDNINPAKNEYVNAA